MSTFVNSTPGGFTKETELLVVQAMERASQEPGQSQGEILAALAGDAGYQMAYGLNGTRYSINRDSVVKEVLGKDGSTDHRVAGKPLIVSGRFCDDRGGVRFELAWMDITGEVKRMVVDAETLNDANKLFRTIPDSAITSVTARACVEYLTDLQLANSEWLAAHTQQVMTALGWGPEGTDAFTFGNGHPHIVQDVKNNGDWINSFRSRGSLQGWIDTVHAVATRVPVQVAVSASLCTPLLRILGAPNFSVDVSGRTSSGKTLSIKGGMSVWGEPAPMTIPWSDTAVAMEHKMSVLRGMPVFIDETQLALKEPEKIQKLVYEITQGKSKGRSTGDGREMLGMSHYETVLITTGETSILNLTKMPGIRPRVVSVTGAPFADKAQADAFEAGCQKSFGLAGPAFVEHLQRQDEVALRARYAAICKTLSDQAGNDIAGRRAGSVAVLQLANELASEIGLVPLLDSDVWTALTDGSSTGENSDDCAREALNQMLNWAVLNQNRFFDNSRVYDEGYAPNGGWVGRWEQKPARNAKCKTPFIGFDKDVLLKELNRLGHPAESTLDEWEARGWLLPTKRRLQHDVTIMGSKTRVVAVTEVEDTFAQERDDMGGDVSNVSSFARKVRALSREGSATSA